MFVKVTVNAIVKEHTNALRIHRLSRNIRSSLKMLSHLFLDFTTLAGVFCGMILRYVSRSRLTDVSRLDGFMEDT